MAQWKVQLVKAVCSLAIGAHLVAVFTAPASVPPSSATIQSTWSLLSPYLHSTNLNHGYHFFAPEPGPSTLIEFTGIGHDGHQRRGVIPDKRRMQPRLLYHRYFMLTEFLGSIPENEPLRQRVIQNYAYQLLKAEQLASVELRLVRHRPSSRQEILIGEDLDAPETYERENLGAFTWPQSHSQNSPDNG